MSEKINIEGREIAIKQVNEEDYISLTDIAKHRENQEPRFVIRSWLGNNSTILFIEEWETLFNVDFNRAGFSTVKEEGMKNAPNITPTVLIERANCISIISKAGRYGGTYAHVDLAFEFASWIEPKFKVRLIRDYRRLRSEEAKRKRIEWNAGRELARLNYPIQTEAIKEVSGSLRDRQRSGAYAAAADMLNKIVFGMTAKQWREQNPEAKGNIRDSASTAQNTVLANLESFNSELIRKGASFEAREKALGDMAVYQMKILNQKYLPE